MDAALLLRVLAVGQFLCYMHAGCSAASVFRTFSGLHVLFFRGALRTLLSWCFTSAKTIRLIRDGALRPQLVNMVLNVHRLCK